MKKLLFITAVDLLTIFQLKAQQLPTLNFRDKLPTVTPLLADNLKNLPDFKRCFFTMPNSKIYERMPVIKPNTNHTMPVVNPSEKGVKYTMLIKRHGFIQPLSYNRQWQPR